MKANDLNGKKFGSLKVIRRIGSRWGHSLWECECECGVTCERTANQLVMNHHVSCGCQTKNSQSKSRLTHGQVGTRLYRIWKAMKTRCYNPNISYFKYYGGKGVTVCNEWRNDFTSFRDWSLRNGYEDDLTIDRIDGDGKYYPNNCRWVTMTVQNRNKKKVKPCMKKSQNV